LRRAGGHFADIRGRSGPGLALADDGSTRLTDKELKKRSQSPLSQQCSAVRLEMD